MTTEKEDIKAVTPKTAGKTASAKKAPSPQGAAPKATSTATKKTASAKTEKTGQTVTVKQVRSGAGRLPGQIATLKGLGLNKMNRSRTLEDTPAIRGMIAKVQHLVEVVDAA